MVARKIISGVYEVGAVDWDRRLFDELIPLPQGTSYNSYIIQGSEKTALIDSVDPPMAEVLMSNLKDLGITKIDYLISNHAEQDHSGSIPRVLKDYPEARVVTNQKCKDLLKDHLHIPDEKFLVINDRQVLSLGNRNLEFIIAPWVHWPETMFTYLKEDKILFSCDFFGSHFATKELYATEKSTLGPAKRYYAEIMMPFRMHIEKHLEKLKSFDISMIATSHGPIYNEPKFIMDAYKDWISDKYNNEVMIAFVSMHGSTAKMVDYLKDKLVEGGVGVRKFNLANADLGEIAMALVDTPTIVLGVPTILGKSHPLAMNAAYIVNALRPKTKYATIIGSYGWYEGVVDQIVQTLGSMKLELFAPVLIKGLPNDENIKQLDVLAQQIIAKHKENNFFKK